MATNPDALRAVFIVESDGPSHQWFKIESDRLARIENPDASAIVAWLESHGYEQRGAFVGNVPCLAVCWLRLTDPRHPEQADSPELLEPIIGERIVPASCYWNRTEGKIATTRIANQIRRHRSRIFEESPYARDLAYVEEPTLAARLKAYGL